MTIYTYSEARQNLSSLLEQVQKQGEVMIKRRDGSIFVLRPISRKKSPLDVPGIDVKINKDEIIKCLREIRER